jgi:hypothetical protein
MDLDGVTRQILDQQRQAAGLTARVAALARQRARAAPGGLDDALLAKLTARAHAALGAITAELRRSDDARRDLLLEADGLPDGA